MNYWLMKSEPSEFSIDDLKARPGKTECWDGVRNYQARIVRIALWIIVRIFWIERCVVQRAILAIRAGIWST